MSEFREREIRQISLSIELYPKLRIFEFLILLNLPGKNKGCVIVVIKQMKMVCFGMHHKVYDHHECSSWLDHIEVDHLGSLIKQ